MGLPVVATTTLAVTLLMVSLTAFRPWTDPLKSSAILGARMSCDRAARRRRSEMGFQTLPTFQVVTPPLVL
ncbi:hypothetical protein D3C72_1379650 [compost metagenome]